MSRQASASHRGAPPPLVPPGRRVALALLLTTALVTVIVATTRDEPHAKRMRPSRPMLEIVADGRRIARVPAADASRSRLRRVLTDRLPTRGTIRRGRAELVVAYDADETLRRALRMSTSGGRIEAVSRTVAARVAAPALKQVQRNTCESAALQILLATVSHNVDQRRLQAALPRSGSPDPEGFRTAAMTWGDPDVGYVGRPDGGGVAGGFGVYPEPVQRTARRFGVQLTNLTGQPPSAVYARLLRGKAVMAWIGLSAGPYGTWRTPQGRQITVNFGEHTVVLHGIDADGSVVVSNPLEGTREQWSRQRFEAMWRLLGNRALAT